MTQTVYYGSVLVVIGILQAGRLLPCETGIDSACLMGGVERHRAKNRSDVIIDY
jgi:hypothetical protein